MSMLHYHHLRDSLRSGFGELPGEVAHARLAPAHRKPASAYMDQAEDFRKAAVLALLFPHTNGEACILLIERSGGGGVHAGQIGFPGGKQEDGETPERTALRETQEELGIDSSQIIMAGALSRLFIPPSRFLVQPFLGFIDELPQLQPNSFEVQKVIYAPVSLFTNQSNVQHGAFLSSGGLTVHSPFFQVQGYKVWGATAMMLSEIAAIVLNSKNQ